MGRASRSQKWKLARGFRGVLAGGDPSLSKALEELRGAGKEGGVESPAARVGVGVR